ncbi:MAG TPA: hypothetical protein VN114_03440 [Oxalicibacterium sp.]|uniref:hypothetical protein n=1 Tax=Oxalicibacterium sp. TaxID=2766525 RepID=UPI002C16AECB|nr:hypothetical protein [Oxalicibacterium sp.]HWU97542.1 hypothetical protein [Oxalicibacterium sp.]
MLVFHGNGTPRRHDVHAAEMKQDVPLHQCSSKKEKEKRGRLGSGAGRSFPADAHRALVRQARSLVQAGWAAIAMTAHSMAGAYMAYARDASCSDTERELAGRKAEEIIAVGNQTCEWLK